MKAVWLVHSRELLSRMRFWTSIVGYNPRDRSLGHAIYLLYVAIFFILWGFAVLALLADMGAGVLTFIGGSLPSTAAIMIVSLLLLIDTLIRGYSSGVRSPFIFSDTDSELLCQTPVDRRPVALIWCMGDWLFPSLAFAALAVVLRFALVQLAEQGDVLWAHIPRYILAGLQVAGIILPVYLAFIAMDYALGALRLGRDVDYPWLRWIPVGVSAILLTLGLFAKTSIKVVLWPLLFILKAGFGEINWLYGFILAVILATASLLVLFWVSKELNLSRAAQESHFRWSVRQVSLLGDSSLSRQLKVRQKLGIGHSPTGLPGRAGSFALIWKGWVTISRAFNFGSLLGWLGIFGIYLGMLLAPDWGTRLWALIIWCLLVGQRCTESMRNDLEVWAISRQLPFSGREILVAEIATPVLGATLSCWLAIGVSRGLGFLPPLSLTLLAPAIILCIVMSAALDILRHCSSSDLLSGRVAVPGAGGLVLGIILAGIPQMIIFWLSNQPHPFGFIILVALLGLILGLGVIYLLWRLVASAYKDIK